MRRAVYLVLIALALLVLACQQEVAQNNTVVPPAVNPDTEFIRPLDCPTEQPICNAGMVLDSHMAENGCRIWECIPIREDCLSVADFTCEEGFDVVTYYHEGCEQKTCAPTTTICETVKDCYNWNICIEGFDCSCDAGLCMPSALEI